MKYWAFLSYSHTDKKWGDWLHKALETYRVPRRLVGRESRDGKVPERVYPIFRDREELPVSADLGSNINEALGESRYLIVICSPRSAQSRWVGEEIKTFKKLGREDRILALIVDGEPNASDGKPGFRVEDECFHEAMRYRMVDGELSDLRSEPIAADAREGKDGKTNAKLKLLAGLLGVNYDDLKQREQERRLKRARTILSASVALIGIFAALSVALFLKGQEAARARDRARAALGQSYLVQGLRAINEDKGLDAIAYLASGIRSDPDQQASICRLVTLLMYRSYALPLCRLPHDDDVLSAQYSPDGQKLVTSSRDATARIWNSQTGEMIGKPMKHDAEVWFAQFSSDSKRILTAAADNVARLWDAESGHPIGAPMRHDERLKSVRFSPDGRRVLTASGSGARIWDAESGDLGKTIDPEKDISDAEFSPDSRLIAVMVSGLETSHGVLQVFDAENGPQPIFSQLGGHSTSFAKVSPDSTRVLGSWAGYISVWSIASGKQIGASIEDNVMARSVEFSPDGRRILTAGWNGAARISDAGAGQPILQPMWHSDAVSSAEYSLDGSRIVTASEDETARVWTADADPLTEPIRHNDLVESAHFSPDSTKIVTTSGVAIPFFDALFSIEKSPEHNRNSTRSFRFDAGSNFTVTRSKEKSAQIWDVRPRKALSQVLEHARGVVSAQFSPNGKQVVTACKDNIGRLWDSETGKLTSEMMKHYDGLTSAQFSPDGKKVVTTSFDKTARIWDVDTGAQVGGQIRHFRTVKAAAFSADGKRIATVSQDGTAFVWDVEKSKKLFELRHEERIESVQFSPGGQRIVTASDDRTARIWDAQTGRPVGEPMQHNDQVVSATFSPDGTMILTASHDGTARLWFSKTGKSVMEPIKHDAEVLSASFSSDGSRILTASRDGTARVWDSKTGEPVSEQMRHENEVLSAQFSPDAALVVTASKDHTARIWDAETGAPLGDPIKHDDIVWEARFSSDGKRLVTVSGNQARVWDVGPRSVPAPPWLAELAEAMSGERLNAQGVIEPLRKRSARDLDQVRNRVLRDAKEDDWARWGRWLLADPVTRTISPFSKVTVPEYIENRIKENTAESLDEAEQLAVGNAELLRRIAQAKQSLPPKVEKENDQ
jgi:WD40 repeat protein